MNTRVLVTVLFMVIVAVNKATATTGFIMNQTPTPLNVAVSNQKCNMTKYCGSLPSSCNPSSQSCYFASAQPDAAGFLFELSGNATGYIAATVTSNSAFGKNETTYICASGSSTVDFYTALLNNITLIPANMSVPSVNGTNNGIITQCLINTTIISATLVNIYNGSYNSTTRDLGNLNFLFQINVTPPLGNSTGSNDGITIQHSMTQALLITAGVLVLALM
ncbi:uncharacterized protein LOC114851153 [Betta splendens]|uniref:Uncharacterized protein LOC114851153 n=1 Tax=Betta splendens TaxID=158456 RepID=A0A6P7LXF9_BETSP|nr:uncharacterized protein LOC114851153 [Betta splendens]